MSRLIDADALMEKIKEPCKDCTQMDCGCFLCDQCEITEEAERLEEAPTVDANHILPNAIADISSAQPSIRDAISAIRQFLDSGKFITTCKFITEDGVCLMTDWGYFEEGLDELERYAKKGEGENTNDE